MAPIADYRTGSAYRDQGAGWRATRRNGYRRTGLMGGNVQPFPLIEISGLPYARGVQFGRACGDLIRRYPIVLRQIQADESRLRGQEVAPKDLDDAELGRRAG